jgi:ATP-dependent helicase/nuclease subunit A
VNAIGHEMIFASAGSGKTHALTTRYLRLLALGVEPERIAALTFTRKAAGEFFGEILRRLAGAAGDAAKAAALAAAIGRPELGVPDFLRLLRALVQAMHRLSLGTLDGYFARVVRTFPLELGLAGEPGLLDEQTATEERQRVLARLFAAGEEPTPEQRALIEAFKLATFGTEDKAVAARFDRFVDAHLALYREAPQASRWGVRSRIWPSGFPWGDGDEKAAQAAAAELDAWAERSPELKEKPRARWRSFAVQAMAWSPGQVWPADLKFVLEKVLADWPAVRDGRAELMIDRQRIAPGPAVCGALATVVRRIVALELGRRMVVTQGIRAVLGAFDKLYDAEVRRAGRLTFADLPQLLADGRGSAGGLRELDYRLDARTDHWLFDEFQDTSHQQWQILEPLVDEVVQDPEGRRSLFYVGDVKQAIFTWRGGDPQLFAHVATRYAGAVQRRELNESWRSGAAVVELVNRVCGNATAMRELFPEASAMWGEYWRTHVSMWPERTGQAALLFAEEEEGRWATTMRLLHAIEPNERGLSCAVLVQTNAAGARLAEYLRREGGIAAVAEADLRVGLDNPVATALAALLRWAAHPGDRLAAAQVAMSPLGRLLGLENQEVEEGAGSAVRQNLQQHTDLQAGEGAEVRCVVAERGFEAWLSGWVRRIEGELGVRDEFTRLRLRQLVAAGRAFDETGSRECDAFLRFLEGYAVREPEGAGVVRVMTVHKSKGLGFDVVILPDLEGNKLAQRRDGPAVRKAADRSVDWVLQHPGALIAEGDPVLREYQADAVAENCYEQLSLLYVALTRAKRAAYVVIEPRGKSASLNYPRLLTATLGEDETEVAVGAGRFAGAWAVGEPEWFRASEAPKAEPIGVAGPEQGGIEVETSRARLVARRPSGLRQGRLTAAQILGGSRAGNGSADFGTAVHALLAQIEWMTTGTVADWLAREGDGIASEVVREVAGCVQTAGGRAVFACCDEHDEVWRERAFEAVVGGAWVSGIFDRVVLRREAGGGLRGVEIYDFKTDRGAPDDLLRARHAEQLGLYRTVAGLLTGLPEDRIRCFVLATEKGRLVEIAFSAR